MKAVVLDIENPKSIRTMASQMASEFPTLNVVINNAGIMRPENLKAPPQDFVDAEAMITTNLMGPKQAEDPRAMPLADFLTEVMQILKTQPNVTEVCVERVKPLRFAAESGKFDATFQSLNEAMPAPH
jgi:short-subunit dehydrogenase involved in D-alanine esterification of teichoic acids